MATPVKAGGSAAGEAEEKAGDVAGMSVGEAKKALRDVLYIDGKWHKHRLDVDWSAAEALIRRVGPNTFIISVMGRGRTALEAALNHEHVPLPLAHRLVTEFGLPTARTLFTNSLDVRAYLLIVHDMPTVSLVCVWVEEAVVRWVRGVR